MKKLSATLIAVLTLAVGTALGTGLGWTLRGIQKPTTGTIIGRAYLMPGRDYLAVGMNSTPAKEASIALYRAMTQRPKCFGDYDFFVRSKVNSTGHYRFESLRPGIYWVVAELGAPFSEVWYIPYTTGIELREGEVAVGPTLFIQRRG